MAPRNSGGFRQLVAWREAKKMAVLMYEMTKSFPSCEQFHLVDQLRRASSSTMANIAEGSMMATRKHRLTYYVRARGSNAEVDSFIELAITLKYITQEQYDDFIDRCARIGYLIHRLIESPI